MSDIKAFLLARIAEDEEYIRDVGRITGMMLGAHLPGSPARVLAECAAKQRIIQLHDSGDAWCDHCAGGGIEGGDCPTVGALAQIYSDHPDYDPSCRPWHAAPSATAACGIAC